MTSKAAPARLIRRYDNRKLYDGRQRRYVVLGDLARMVGAGEEVRVGIGARARTSRPW